MLSLPWIMAIFHFRYLIPIRYKIRASQNSPITINNPRQVSPIPRNIPAGAEKKMTPETIPSISSTAPPVRIGPAQQRENPTTNKTARMVMIQMNGINTTIRLKRPRPIVARIALPIPPTDGECSLFSRMIGQYIPCR